MTVDEIAIHYSIRPVYPGKMWMPSRASNLNGRIKSPIPWALPRNQKMTFRRHIRKAPSVAACKPPKPPRAHSDELDTVGGSGRHVRVRGTTSPTKETNCSS